MAIDSGISSASLGTIRISSFWYLGVIRTQWGQHSHPWDHKVQYLSPPRSPLMIIHFRSPRLLKVQSKELLGKIQSVPHHLYIGTEFFSVVISCRWVRGRFSLTYPKLIYVNVNLLSSSSILSAAPIISTKLFGFPYRNYGGGSSSRTSTSFQCGQYYDTQSSLYRMHSRHSVHRTASPTSLLCSLSPSRL